MKGSSLPLTILRLAAIVLALGMLGWFVSRAAKAGKDSLAAAPDSHLPTPQAQPPSLGTPIPPSSLPAIGVKARQVAPGSKSLDALLSGMVEADREETNVSLPDPPALTVAAPTMASSSKTISQPLFSVRWKPGDGAIAPSSKSANISAVFNPPVASPGETPAPVFPPPVAVRLKGWVITTSTGTARLPTPEPQAAPPMVAPGSKSAPVFHAPASKYGPSTP